MNWYCKFWNWWGPIDNTLLSPFPVVQAGHVVAPETSQKMESEMSIGAEDDRLPTPMDDSASKDIGAAVGNGFKKRKADLIA